MILRLALLPAIQIPKPRIADEFGYLLLADVPSRRDASPIPPIPCGDFLNRYTCSTSPPTLRNTRSRKVWMMRCRADGFRRAPLVRRAAECRIDVRRAVLDAPRPGSPPKWALFGALPAGVRFDAVTS